MTDHSIFQLEPGSPSYLIPKSAAERLAHHRGLLERMNALLRWTWCWTHGLIRGQHDCTTIVREEIDMWEVRQLSEFLATLDLSSLDEATRGLPTSRKVFEGIEKAVWGDMPTADDGEPHATNPED